MQLSDLKSYFEGVSGMGVLSTCSAAGDVNSALYGRPHFLEDGSFALIMNDRLSHANLLENPKAAYMFVEEGSKSKGIRIYIEKSGETDDPELINKIRRHHSGSDNDSDKKRFLVSFNLLKTRDLVERG